MKKLIQMFAFTMGCNCTNATTTPMKDLDGKTMLSEGTPDALPDTGIVSLDNSLSHIQDISKLYSL